MERFFRLILPCLKPYLTDSYSQHRKTAAYSGRQNVVLLGGRH